MTFVVKKLAEHGTSHPVVARLSVQTFDVIQFFSLDKAREDDLKEIYARKVQSRVLDCTEIASAIGSEVDEIKNTVNASGLRTQSHGRVVDIPQIMRLRERSETYLYNAKSALRDLSETFRVLFGKEFGHSRFNEIHDWARETLGEQSPTVSFLSKEVNWIKYVADLRNSVEHPENKRRGPLVIQNFELVGTDATGTGVLREPVWFFNGMNPASIRIDMDALAHNLLTFAEELLVVAHRQLHPGAIVQFAEIPESDRRKDCPTRLRAVLNPKKINPPPASL
jgi:hypothetical protein